MGDIVDIKKLDIVQNVFHGKTRRVSTVFPSMLLLLQIIKLRTRFLLRELMCVLSILGTLRAYIASGMA